MSYRSYLHGRGMSHKTSTAYERHIEKFEIWLEDEGIGLGEVRHAQMMLYTAHLRSKGVTAHYINGILRAIRYYFTWNGIRPNPCWQIKVRGTIRKIPTGLLTEEEISTLYDSHPEQFARQICQKVYLGLLCFQALNKSEILNLEISHINLEIGYMRIIGTDKINSRTLRLSERQRPILEEYLTQSRSEIIPKETYSPHLITNAGKVQNTVTVAMKVNRWLKKRGIKNPNVIRASVISNWIKRHNLRETQYMAGHKYVSSTERYRRDNLEDLQRALDQWHPLK